MRAKKFELFMGCLGNGTTVCNKAVKEHGDYKTIAHISPAGNIKLYVPADYIPPDAMEAICNSAARDRERFIDNLELEIKHRPHQIYEKMLDALSTSEWLDFSKKHSADCFEKKITALVSLYLDRS